MNYLTILIFLSFSFSIIDDPNDPIRSAGDVGQILIPVSALLLTYIKDDYNGTLQLCKSSISTIICTHIFKLSIEKFRPDGTNNNSFPSGHTSAAFSGATFIHQRYGFKMAFPAYAIASFVGYSRIYAKKHYLEDVIAGATLAAINSIIFNQSRINNVSLMLSNENENNVLKLNINF